MRPVACLVLILVQSSFGLLLTRLCPFVQQDCLDPSNCVDACENITRNAAQNLLVGKPLEGLIFDSISLKQTSRVTSPADDAFSGFTDGNFGIVEGLVLSTGSAILASTPDPSSDIGEAGPDYAALTLRFNASATAVGTAVRFEYVFASTELLGKTALPSSSLDVVEILWNQIQIGRLSDGQHLSISTLAPDPADTATWHPDFRKNTLRTLDGSNRFLGFPGYTAVLTATGPIVEGPNELVIRVSDTADGFRDSALFIKKRSLVTDALGFAYSAGEWSACSATCKGGVQTRSIECVDPQRRPTVGEMCVGQLKPLSEQPCGALECSYSYAVGEWSACSSTCGQAGVTSRSVDCVAGSSFSAVAESFCAALSRPDSTVECIPERPCYEWSLSEWGMCSATCGAGKRERKVSCLKKDLSMVEASAEPSKCVELAPPVPDSEYALDGTAEPMHTAPCAVGSCKTVAQYVTGDWGACSVSCGGGTASREVACQSVAGDPLPPTTCQLLVAGDMPQTSKSCGLVSCSGVGWVTGSWCTDWGGGVGAQTSVAFKRSASCVDVLGEEVEPHRCAHLPSPALSFVACGPQCGTVAPTAPSIIPTFVPTTATPTVLPTSLPTAVSVRRRQDPVSEVLFCPELALMETEAIDLVSCVESRSISAPSCAPECQALFKPLKPCLEKAPFAESLRIQIAAVSALCSDEADPCIGQDARRCVHECLPCRAGSGRTASDQPCGACEGCTLFLNRCVPLPLIADIGGVWAGTISSYEARSPCLQLTITAGLDFTAYMGECWAGSPIDGALSGRLQVWQGPPCHSELGCAIDLLVSGEPSRPGRMWERQDSGELLMVLLSQDCVHEPGCAAQTSRPTEPDNPSLDPRLDTITLLRETAHASFGSTDTGTLGSVLPGFGISTAAVSIEGDPRSFGVVKGYPLGAHHASGLGNAALVASVVADDMMTPVTVDASMVVTFAAKSVPIVAVLEVGVASAAQGPVCHDLCQISHEACVSLGFARGVTDVPTTCDRGSRCFELQASGGAFGHNATIRGCMEAGSTCNTYRAQGSAIGAEVHQCAIVPSVSGSTCADTSGFEMTLNGQPLRITEAMQCVAMTDIATGTRLPLNQMRLSLQPGDNVLKVRVSSMSSTALLLAAHSLQAPAGVRWKLQEWGACSVSCSMSRNAVCVGPNDEALDAAACTRLLPPRLFQTCSGGACSARLVAEYRPGKWGECECPLSGGLPIRHRFVACVDPGGRALPASACSNKDAPEDTKLCTESLLECPTFTWIEFRSGVCSASCGGGMRVREMRCMAGQNLGDDELCGLRPPELQECNTVPCDQVPGAKVGPWSACSASCGGGLRTREVVCLDALGARVPDDLCKGMPAAVEACALDPCTPGSYRWAAGQFCTTDLLGRSCGPISLSRQLWCVPTDSSGSEASAVPSFLCNNSVGTALAPTVELNCLGVTTQSPATSPPAQLLNVAATRAPTELFEDLQDLSTGEIAVIIACSLVGAAILLGLATLTTLYCRRPRNRGKKGNLAKPVQVLPSSSATTVKFGTPPDWDALPANSQPNVVYGRLPIDAYAEPVVAREPGSLQTFY